MTQQFTAMKTKDKLKNEEVIYTDGHGVKITEKRLYTEEKAYLLEGITSVQLKKRPASILHGMLLLFLGVICLAGGGFGVFDYQQVEIGETLYRLDINLILQITGVVLILLGILSYVIKKDRYSVLIGTAEGLREPVISKSREYTSYIVSVLEQIFARRSYTRRRVDRVVH